MTYVTLDEMITKIQIRIGMYLGNDQDVKSLSSLYLRLHHL